MQRNCIYKDLCEIIFSGPGVERVAEEVKKIFPEKNLAYLSGPTFANEVVKGLPSAATLATIDISVSQLLAEELSNKTFRIYSSTDIVGVQVGGAVKNVLAIASGMARGSGFGEDLAD